MKVLVVDDDRFVRVAVARILEDAGHEVCTASSAESAEHSVVLERPDVVLLDIQLGPGMNGVQLASRLPRGLPIVFMSGVYSSTEIHQMAERPTHNPDVSALYIGKPIDPALLLAAITDAANRRAK